MDLQCRLLKRSLGKLKIVLDTPLCFFVLSLLFFLEVDRRESIIRSVLSLVLYKQGWLLASFVLGFKSWWQEAFVIFVLFTQLVLSRKC